MVFGPALLVTANEPFITKLRVVEPKEKATALDAALAPVLPAVPGTVPTS